MSTIDPRLDTISDGLYRVSARAIIVRNRQLLMSHEAEGWYSLPGGGVIHGETVEQALERELTEELGLPAQTIMDPLELLTVHLGVVMAGVPRANLYYRVELPADARLPGGELDYKWVSDTVLEQLPLSPATTGLRDFLKSLLQA